MTPKYSTLLIILLCVLGPAWIFVSRAPGDGTESSHSLPPAPAVGHPAPDITATTLDGETFTLSELRGKPVVLNFWATWCPPCRAELPELQAAAERYDGEVVIAGVNQSEPADAVRAFASQLGLNFVVPLDADGAVSRLYGVRSLPTTFFIDRQGVIRQMQIGPVTEATLAQLLRSIYP
jgi:peroxiredoxin